MNVASIEDKAVHDNKQKSERLNQKVDWKIQYSITGARSTAIELYITTKS